jgi:hypothetical protein
MTSSIIEAVLFQYAATGLWSELDPQGTPLCATYGVGDIDTKSLDAMADDVIAFLDSCTAERPHVFDTLTTGQIGHNFWLTRNRHGAGFWDLGLGERGQWLTQMAHPFGECRLVVPPLHRILRHVKVRYES